MGSGYGFSLSESTLIDRIDMGGSAAVAGLQVNDLVVMVNGERLMLGEKLTLKGSQCEGTRLTLTCHRKRMSASTEKRKRTAVQQPGMSSWVGVRMGNAPRTRVQRMVDRFESGTADSL